MVVVIFHIYTFLCIKLISLCKQLDMSFHMIISCRCDLHFVLQSLNSMNTNNQPSGHNFFPYNPFD